MLKKKGYCGYCQRRVGVTRNNLASRHAFLPENYERCPGSGRPAGEVEWVEVDDSGSRRW